MRERLSDDTVDVETFDDKDKPYNIDKNDAQAVKTAVAVQYTQDDFLYTEKPYEAVYVHKDDPLCTASKLSKWHSEPQR